MRSPRSLQGRLLALVLGTVIVVWTATASMTWVDVRHELDELLDAHLAQAAALLVVQQAGEMENDDRRVDAPSLHRYAPKVAFQVFREGRLALRSANAPVAPMTDRGFESGNGFATIRISGAAWRVFHASTADHDVHVYVGEELGSRAEISWAALHSTLLPLAVALPLLALAVWWAVRRGVAPMRRLSSTLARRQAQALDPVRLDDAPSEMVPMIDALNGLLGRISTLMASERRFTADAAHELRTPIAAIRAQAQVAMGEADDRQRARALQKTLDGCDRASHLVEQLLTLSRLEAGDAPALGPIDLTELTRRVVADMAPMAIGRQQSIGFEGSQPCVAVGNEALSTVLVRNLVENAVRYSPDAARIAVDVSMNNGQVVMRVEDSGPGLDAADLARLGERFFRKPRHDEPGSGLGWSIVRRIAVVQDMQVQTGKSASLGGLAVTVSCKAWTNFEAGA